MQRRLDWSAGGPWVAGRGSCRGSIQRWHGHIMLELARDMWQMRTVPLHRSDGIARPSAWPKR